ncbi:MAG TPA: thiamine pyrophosphate-dependent dehydrogenase E1 component subunit alpha [Syntrophorhabdus sp.]|jgi:TPP-dependent pyruvate/acetoin dehydrogenase alpha subunit|nr:thiamine pyrophosphate-dependent dehydrogenase E1 component subunit alpha [Syntrophorhabdus sp.]
MTLPKDILRDLYKTMIIIRFFEESLVEPILKREIHTPCHLCSGQEAVAVGLCKALSKDDYIFGNHRSHGHFLAKGGSLKALAAEIYCREAGCSRGRGGSMHLIDPTVGMLGSAPIVAGTISLAVGAALASSIRKDGRISASFFGDGATGEGVLYESMNFAALKKLPIIFACENNLYATHMPIRECRVNRSICKIAESFGIENYEVDGNDVLQVYDMAKKAVGVCREGNGPVFIEFLTYRYRGHVGPDDNIHGFHTDIRPREELAHWLEKDPIQRLERFIRESHIMDEQELQSLKREAGEEVRDAKSYAESSARPRTEEITNYVFA